MAKKPESRLQAKIRKALIAEFGGYWIKIWTGPFQVRGFPDLLGCVDGMFYALEVKMPGEEPSDYQVLVMSRIKKAGGCTGVVTSIEEACELVRRFRRRAARRI